MKKLVKLLSVIALANLTLIACAQDKKEVKTTKVEASETVKQEPLAMNKDTLNARIIADMQKEIIKQKVALTKEALSTVAQTQNLIQLIEKGDNKTAINKGKKLVGDLEVLLAKDPSLALVPVNVTYQEDEFVGDINTVKETTKLVKEAVNKGYYRVASDLLTDLRSEMVINTYLIPTATYPEAIKAAVVALEANKPELAEGLLIEVLNTVVIEKVVLPLPVLKSEQMIIEAASIDAKDHENIDQVIALLSNAEYQLQLAEALGYGKKDKDYVLLSKAIKEVKKSVKAKKDSKPKFDKLRSDLKKFQERLFPRTKKHNKK
ncbi:MAG TPA: YfdX family protein [Flavobacteriia bacterium]|nr:YfdX family protein [Flavobacteriia bacterium]